MRSLRSVPVLMILVMALLAAGCGEGAVEEIPVPSTAATALAVAVSETAEYQALERRVDELEVQVDELRTEVDQLLGGLTVEPAVFYECTSDEPPVGIMPPAGSGEGSPQIPIGAVALHGAAFMERADPVEEFKWGCGFVVEAESLIDGLFFPASQYWDEGAVWWDTNDGQERWIELDLGDTFTIDAAIVQADDNDSYLLSYRDLGTGEWVTMWSIPAPGGFGMQTRPNPADNTARQVIDPPIITDRLRFEADQGDNLYSVSEIQVFGTASG